MRNDPNVLRLVHIAIAAVFQVESLRLGTSFLRRGRLIFLFFDTGAKAFVWLPVFFATTFVWLPVFFATAFVWLPVFFTTPGFLVVVWLPVYFAAGFSTPEQKSLVRLGVASPFRIFRMDDFGRVAQMPSMFPYSSKLLRSTICTLPTLRHAPCTSQVLFSTTNVVVRYVSRLCSAKTSDHGLDAWLSEIQTDATSNLV